MHALAMPDDVPKRTGASGPQDGREPGAPIGRDELDPDLIKLRRPAPSIGTITAAAVVILCVTLLVRLRHDLAFSGGGAKPREVTVEQIVSGKIGAESYVTLAAPPDRVGAIRVRTSEAYAGNRLVAVRGTGDKLWLALPGDHWAGFEHDDRITGRLRRLGDVRFAGPLAAALRTHPSPRFITGAELRRVRGAPPAAPGAVTLIDGVPLALVPGAEIEISVDDPGAAIVVAALSPGRPDLASWREALTTAGVIAAGAEPFRVTDDLARWEVRRPDAVKSIQTALDDAMLWGARVEPANTRVRAPWDQLVVSDAGVAGPDGVIPWSAIDVAAVWSPRAVPAGAWVVVTDEKPADYWYLKLVYAGLGLFALLFGWALVRAIRRQFLDRGVVATATALR